MQFLDMIQLETLRMHSPAVGLFDRITIADSQIADIQVRKNTSLTYVTKSNLLDDNIFEEADKFKP